MAFQKATISPLWTVCQAGLWNTTWTYERKMVSLVNLTIITFNKIIIQRDFASTEFPSTTKIVLCNKEQWSLLAAM